jgi:heptosyltransferase I
VIGSATPEDYDIRETRAQTIRGDCVCIVLLSGIGDVVHGLPVAVALKRNRPSRKIVWVAQPVPAQVLEHHPAVDQVIIFRPERGLRGVYDLWSAFRAGPSFDLTLNMQRYGKSVFPTYLSGAPVRVGLAPSRTRDGVRFVNTEYTSGGEWRHTQDLFLEFLDVVGVERPNRLEWEITLSEEEESAAEDFFSASEGAPIVGLALGTANPAKDWPADRYVSLARALETEFGFDVLLLGGPGKGEQATARAVLDDGRVAARSALSNSVRQLIWSIRGCDLVISPDTSALHIAHAMGIPVIGLFGHTNPWRVGPYEQYHDLVVDRYTDPGESRTPAHYGPRPGRMPGIAVSDVLERVGWARERYGVGRNR